MDGGINGTKTENDGKHINENGKNTNTYEAYDNTSALGSVSASLMPAPISESTNDKTTMCETKTY